MWSRTRCDLQATRASEISQERVRDFGRIEDRVFRDGWEGVCHCCFGKVGARRWMSEDLACEGWKEEVLRWMPER